MFLKREVFKIIMWEEIEDEIVEWSCDGCRFRFRSCWYFGCLGHSETQDGRE